MVKRGLKSSYVVREDNLNVFKGKLLVKDNLRRNVAHREKFFVAYDEYGLDRPEHRLIKAALWRLKRVKSARRLLGAFESVATSTNCAKDFAALSIDKTNRDYKAVMNWTRLFLAEKSFTPFDGRVKALALLFDMNRLFEAYVAAHARKVFADKFTLDTKWEDAPTSADMYQMFAYAKRYGARKIYLLLPATENAWYRTEDLTITIQGVEPLNVSSSLKTLLKSLPRTNSSTMPISAQ